MSNTNRHIDLIRAVARVNDRGRLTPCQVDPAAYLSEDKPERQEAAAACASCPVLSTCAEHADQEPERWHVWAGVDRTRPTRKREAR